MATPFMFNSSAKPATSTGGSLFNAQNSTLSVSSAPAFGYPSTTTNATGTQPFGTTHNTGLGPSFGTLGNAGTSTFGQPAPAVAATPKMFNSRCTVRLLTQHVPQWRGHFDIADVMLSAHEKSIVKVRGMVDRLVELDKQSWESHENIKNSLNGISLLQSKLQREVNDRCKRQDTQNMISIKARRLSESLQTNETPRGSKVSAAFRVPNHLHVHLTKELLDTIRSWRREINVLQLEVLSLKDIELSQYVSTVKVVLGSHDKRIANIGNRVTKAVSSMDVRLRDRKGLWEVVADEPSELKKAFLTAVGLPVRPPVSQNDSLAVSCSESSREIKKQIAYLRKFNSAFTETGKSAVDSCYNIREVLQKPTPPPTSSQLFGSIAPVGAMVGGAPAGTAGGSLFGATSTTPGTGLFGSTTGIGLFGTAAKPAGITGTTTTTGTTGLFGATPASNTGTTGLFGATTTGTTGTGLFGTNTATTTGTGLFGTKPTGTTTGSTGLFGAAATTTAPATTGTGLFGTTNTSTGVFGTAAAAPATTGAGLFGSTTAGTTTSTTGTGLFGSAATAATPTAGTGLFGSTTTGTTGTGSGLFGTTASTTGNTGLFGATNTSSSQGLFGSTTATTTGGQQQQQTSTTGGLFGLSGTGTNTSQQTTVSKSTAIVPYNPNPLLR
ncbi:Nuclear pore complex protein Nup98-Nup96 [Babesia sp. Xinjiang]|uniref:Nuclear pore complex protein Nup98-Nup96 n=1 Tax=Babesia sp. Xinjiang TaxID=462227 RepID=UPI000A243152|nr:Nuclear pore complex protein Nup98-Nup96 [Babesia sp. Xinjiang]ORM40077.1 Nuclear pore complex protein Nup98-Nup96 [Babesia sp. Xinjiang]